MAKSQEILFHNVSQILMKNSKNFCSVLFVCLFVCLFVFWVVCLFVCWVVCLFVCLYFNIFVFF